MFENLNELSNEQLQELLVDIAEELKDRGFEQEGREINTISYCLD